jgi:transcriptional regulator with XRE-family HTH domain
MHSKSGNLDNVGSRLRAERERLNFNQAEFAALGGVQRNAQVSYETGKSSPTVSYLHRLADHGVDIGYVLTGCRQENNIGAYETALLDGLGKLSANQRNLVLALIEEFTGSASQLADPIDVALASGAIAAIDPDHPEHKRLHSPKSGYRPEDEKP